MRCAGEDVTHQVALAARKNELASVALLDVGAQQGLHVLLGKLCDLLEFVDGDDIGTVGVFEILEDFLQRGLWLADVAQLDVELGKPRQVGGHHE